MKLYDLLRTIEHENYNVILRDVNAMNIEREVYNYNLQKDQKGELLKNYLDYNVVCVSEDWNITIATQKM